MGRTVLFVATGIALVVALGTALLGACGEGPGPGSTGSGSKGPASAGPDSSGAGQPAREPPSVLLVSIDTLRADHVGLYGYGRDTTPFLDRWARNATVFEQAYTTAAWTLVAHMTMLTGLFPEQHDVIGKNRALSPEIPLLAETLKAAGYATCALYAPGWIDRRHGFDRGFDVFRPHEDLAQADVHLKELMDELPGERPFFLFVHLFDVHCGPFEGDSIPIYPAPEPYQHMFVTDDMEPWPSKPAKDLWWTRNVLGPEEFRTAAALYDGGIRQVDDQLALWFGMLEERGLLANTLMIVTADHGEALGQRGILDKHGDCFQEGLHIPLIVRDATGRAAGTRVPRPVHLGDLVPTILEAAGLPVDPRLPGLPLFGPLPEERPIYGIKLPEAFVLKGQEKVVLEPQNHCLLMDLANDPQELAPREIDRARFDELRAEAMAGGGEFPRHIRADDMSPEERAALEALGYAGEDEDH